MAFSSSEPGDASALVEASAGSSAHPEREAERWLRAAQAATGRGRAEALLRAAEIVGGALGQAREAHALRRRAWLNDPAHPEALRVLGEHAETTGDGLLLARVQAQRFALADSAAARAELARSLAALEHRVLHHRAAARDWIDRGIAAAPDDVPLREARAELAREAGESAAWLEQLEQLIRLQGRDARAPLLCQAAALHAARGATHAALTHLQRATEVAPEDPEALAALAELLARLERHADLANVLERRIVLATSDPKGRAALLLQLGALHEAQLFDPDAALDAYRRARALAPDAPGLEAALLRLEEKRDGSSGTPAVEGALAAFEREAETTHDRERLGVLVREIVRLHTRLEQPDRALPWVQRWIALCPEEPDALRALAALHDRPGLEARAVVALEALDRLLEPAAQTANRHRIATVYAGLGRHEDAERVWSRALELDPADPVALEGRVRALRALDRVADLAVALERLAEHQDRTPRQRTRRELAGLLERHGDLAGAIDVLSALEGEEGPAEVSEALDDLLDRLRRHEQLEARLALRTAALEPGTAEALALELRRASLLLEALGRPADAAEGYRRVLEHAPASREARSGLERALRSSVDARGLAAFLAEEEARAEDPAARDRLALERAVLLEDLLDRPEEALGVLTQLARESAVPEVLGDAERRAEQLLERLHRWSELRAHLERRIGRHSDAEDARLHERLARLCADRLGDGEAAVLHLERIVALDPGRVDVWQALAARYERDGRLEDWVRALEAELAAGPDHARELGLRARLAELYRDRLRLPDRAREHYELVFELSPAHSAAAQFLVDSYERESRFEDVIHVLEARLASIDVSRRDDPHAPQRRTALRLQIAGIRDAKLDDLEGAISALEVALGEVGADSVIAEPLAAAYQRAGYAGDLIDLCRRAAAQSAEAEERANWWVRLGDAHLSRDERREATDAYRRALIERPGDRAVEASLRELYRGMGQREPLAELLEGELRHLAGASEIPVRIELVDLLSKTRPAAALLHARRVLQLEPRHAAARDAAVSLALATGQPEEALAVMEGRLRDGSRPPAERAEDELQRARLLAGPLARLDEATRAYRDLIAAHPGRRAREGLAELTALLEGAQRWEEWLACTACRLGDLAPGERAEHIDRVSRIAWERVSPAAALPWLERLRRERPGDVDVLSRISLAHRELGQEEALLRALESEAAALPPGDRRRRIQMERAALLRGSGSAGRALAVLTEIGRDAEALGLREQIERELGLHERRAVTLEALLALRGPDLALHRDLALLYAVDLARPQEARRHWEAAQGLVPPDSAAQLEILRALAETERSAGRIDRWARCAERELASLDPVPVFDDRRRELRRELAAVYDEELARSDAALVHLRALLDAGDGELLGHPVLDRVERACLRLLRASGEPVELETRLARRLDRIGGSVGEWLELALLREETLRWAAGAQEAYRRALAEDPGQIDALRGVRRNAARLGRWRDVADALEREIEQLGDRDPVQRGALLRALGDLHWHRLQSTTRASRCYAAALEANATDFAALRALERLLEAMEDWRGALDLYESEVAVLGAANPGRRREIWLRVASLAGERADDPERARHALLQAAAIEPLDAGRLADLALLHERLGDREAFIDTFAAWCDSAAEATGADLLRLALALEQAGRTGEAAARIESAAARDPEDPRIWDAAARLRAARGDHLGSAQALERAADRLPDDEAADRLRAAAEPLRALDPAAALALLRSAAQRAPGHAAVQALRAHLAAELGEDAEAETAARAALESPAAAELEPSEAAAAARAGADAARRRGQHEAAAGLYREALRRQPDDVSALGPYGETLLALGDHPAARAALERRLASAAEDSQRASHRALLGRCLELAGRPEEALAHYRAALEYDPAQPLALEASVRVLEELDRIEPGVAAIERWARAAREPGERAARLLRAARWERRRGARDESAAGHLRAAVAADAELAPAWIALATLQLEGGHLDAVVETTDRAARHMGDPVDLGRLAHLQGRALEQKGARREAASTYGIAAECDPRCADAALAQARLLRGFGEWREAAAALATFAERHPCDEGASLADVYEQLGRLRAGPLEDLDGAVLSYRRAIELAPERREARAALAELLSHRPGDWEEAIEHHRVVLAACPTHPGSLRAALHIARGRGAAAAVAAGVAIQRALGIASPYETGQDSGAAGILLTREPVLLDARFELLRRLAVEAADEIASALGASPPGHTTPSSDDPVLAFRGRMLTVQGELSAPALLALSTREVEEVLGLLVELVFGPGHVSGDGNLVNALSEALGRRRRRKLRRMLGERGGPAEDLRAIDFAAWLTEMRALAASETLRQTGAPLRTAILATIARVDDASENAGESHLAPRVEGDPAARAFLGRVVGDWLAHL